MDYDKIVFSIYSNILQDIHIDNNEYKFSFLNIDRCFYEFANKYYNLIDTKIDKNIIELCILFEYIYLNQVNFLKIYNNETTNECMDILFFLNLNIKLKKIINEKLSKIDCASYIIDILNTTKYTDYINNLNYDLNKVKQNLVIILFKIINK